MGTPETAVARRVDRPRWGVVCMLLSIVFFSANALTLKQLAESNISPWIALLFRAGVGMVLVTLMFRLNGQVSFRRASTNRMLACRGLLGVLGTIAYYLTLPELGPGKATLIGNTYVVIAALMAVLFLKESFNTTKLAGNVLAFLGLALLVAYPSESGLFGWYEALAIFGALMAAGTVIVIRKLTLTESTATIYTSQCVYILVGSLPFAIYELQRQHLDRTSWFTLIMAGVSATIGQLAMTEGFRHLTVAVGGAFQICVPVVIAIGSVLIFKESFTAAQVLGAILILGGCYLVMQIRSNTASTATSR
jgi:drug/metabolite transporter (DMT)-like permease